MLLGGQAASLGAPWSTLGAASSRGQKAGGGSLVLGLVAAGDTNDNGYERGKQSLASFAGWLRRGVVQQHDAIAEAVRLDQP